MSELTVPSLLARTPEASPPWRWRLLLIPIFLAIVGILIATVCAISGQESELQFQTIQIQKDCAHAEAALAQAQLRHDDPDTLAKLQSDLDAQRSRKPSSYTQDGRQFTQWDGYRYEEIVTKGYLYHRPDDPQSVKDSPFMTVAGESEQRLKNVTWYPLYPLLASGLSKVLGISANAALTTVSQVSIILASVVLFLYARRHYYNRMPRLEGVPHRWDLSSHDAAAVWACAALLYAPCSVFFYANYTESLFILLLVSFLYCLQGRSWWCAAVVAALAGACRAQGVLFGPMLALLFLLRSDIRNPLTKLGVAAILGCISAIGIGCYMAYLQSHFGDALAFSHAQQYWNVGIHREQLFNAVNPLNAITRLFHYAFYVQPMDWPRLWEAFCIIWPPIVLILGGRFLSIELKVVGWLLWGLPYVSNGLAGNPVMASQWMSMGRFMTALLPAHIIFGAVFGRFRWAGVPWLAFWAATFGAFAYKFGAGAWVG